MLDRASHRCARARTFLFVPGNKPERFEKALNSGADAVILDLEDAVPAQEKQTARNAIVRHWARLAVHAVPIVIRTNAHGHAAWEADLALIRELEGLAGVMLPKAESVHGLQRLRTDFPDLGVLPLIESAGGLENLKGISSMPNVIRLVVGHIDFMTDTGITCSDDERELDPLRFAVSMVSRTASLAPPVDGVTVQTNDAQRLAADTHRGKRFGFAGKLCIHPQQVNGIHAALAPSQEEVEWSRRVLQADADSHGAAVQLDGRMVDLPVVLQARRTLAMAERQNQP